MSTTVDSRVVEMQFDNRQFERNVSTTMSTLEKLKQRLNLTGAAKGFENIDSASRKINLTGISNAVETVRTRFSALEVMGVTALANITNSAVNAGKRIASALTIDPIKTGFSEYETKINAIQTIMSNTASKGTTMEDVTRVIGELNTYADKTIYNFAEMTRNIGTFTAAGVGLQESADAIQGIANLAAASGSTSQQASTAMYQLSQALAAGTVKLMDWNSVVNAGMGGEKFQEALKATAREYGVAVDDIIARNGSFRESLSEGWITADILNKTLQKFTKKGAKEYADAMVKSGKYTQEQADALIKEAQAMEDAATKVKTFTQLFDTLKESAQSGWAQTWELIFGDFEEAKDLFTKLSDFFGGFINKMSEARNSLLESALGRNFLGIWERVKGIVDPAAKSLEKVETVIDGITRSLEEHEAVVASVINGDWNNGIDRYNKLTEAGYDWAHVQNLVNEKLGDSTRHSSKYTEALANQAKVQKTSAETSQKMTKENAKYIASLADKSEAELESLGYTKKQIEALKDLKMVSDKLGLSIEELLINMDDINGRWILLNSFKNIGSSIVKIFKAMGNAWKEIFPPMTTDQLFGIISGFHKLTTYLKMSDETAGKLERTFKGVFAAIDIIVTILSGGARIAFKIIQGILSVFHLDILDVTAAVGDAIVKFRDWIDSILDFKSIFAWMAPGIRKAANAIKTAFSKIREYIPFESIANGCKRFIASMKGVMSSFGKWLDGLKETDNIPKYIIEGLLKGLKAGASAVWNGAVELGKKMLEGIKNFLGIHSPSTKFMEVGKNVIAGLVNGLKTGTSAVFKTLKNIFSSCIDYIKKIDFGALLATGIAIGSLTILSKIANAILAFASPFEGIGEMIETVTEGIGDNLKANALQKKSKALINFAVAIGILAASVALLARIDAKQMGIAAGVIAGLAIVMVVLAGLLNNLSLFSKFGGAAIAVNMVGIATAMLLMAATLQKLATIDANKLPVILKTFLAILASLVLVMIAFGKFCNVGASVNMGKAGSMLLKMSIAMLLMTVVIKQASKLDSGAITKGLGVIAAVGVLFAALITVSRVAGRHASRAGGMLLKMSLAFMVMALVIKVASKLDRGEVKRGLGVIALVGTLFVALIAVSILAGRYGSKAGGMLLKMSIALLIITGVIKMASKLDRGEVKRGLGVIALVGTLFVALIAVSILAGRYATRAGIMLLLMSGALVILTGIMFLLSKFDPDGLKRSVSAMSVLLILITGMIASTKLAEKVRIGPLIALTVAVGILALAVAGLSFIDPKKLAASTAALTMVLSAFALVLTATKFAKNTKSMRKTLIQMIGVVAVLTAIVVALSFVNPKKALPNVAALSLLLLAFSGAMVILSSAGRMSKTVSKQIIPMLVVVSGLALIVAGLSILNPGSVLTSVASLSVLLLSFSTCIRILSGTTKYAAGALGSIAIMLSITAGLAGILVGMSALDTQNAIGNATAISVLLLAMSASLGVLKAVSKNAMAGVGAIALLGLVVAELALILWGMSALDINPSIEVAKALSLLLITMSASLVVLGAVGMMGSGAFVGIAALATLIAGIGGLITGIGALVTQFPMLEDFLNTGIPIIEKIGHAIGSFFGNIVGGFAEGAVSSLPKIGEYLSQFMVNAQPFIDGAKNVDGSVLAGIGVLTGAVIALTAADIISGMTSFMGGGPSFAKLGSELSAFMSNAEGFISGASSLNEAMITGVKALAETVLILTAANVLEGLTAWFTGGSSLSKFGEQLPELGTHLNEFTTNLGSFSEDQVTTVTCAANAIKALAKAADTLPNEGGWAAKILGDNSIATFGSYLPGLGTNLRGFVTSLGTFTEDQVTTVTCAADAVKALAKAAEAIPNEGGWAAKILGDNSIATFGSYLPGLGTNLSQFATNLGTFSKAQVTTVDCAASAIKSIAKAAEAIPNEGGWAAKILGDNSIATFGSKLPALGLNMGAFAKNLGTFNEANVTTVDCASKAIKAMASAASGINGQADWAKKLFGDNSIATFAGKLPAVGTSLKGFVNNLGSFGEDKIATVDAAIRAITAFSKLADTDLKNASKDLSDFGTKIVLFGQQISLFCGSLADGNMISTAVSNLKKVVTSIKEAASNTSAVKDFTSSLEKLGENGISSFVKAFNNATNQSSVEKAAKKLADKAIKSIESQKDEFKKTGKNSAEKVIDGLETKKDGIKTACKTLASSGVAGIKEKYQNFYSAGKYLVEGFAAGISDNTYLSTAKAVAMASAAEKAAKEELRQNSPSKVFIKIGESVPEGFAIGIGKFGSLIKASSSDMASTAISGVQKAITNVASIIDSDIDAQPTIRPVMDLSEVRAGAGAIETMFSGRNVMGVRANVGVISSMMNSRIQNGDNSDIVSAINKLRDGLDNVGGTSYNINGVSYNDGSDVAEALKTIVHAARRERRV